MASWPYTEIEEFTEDVKLPNWWLGSPSVSILLQNSAHAYRLDIFSPQHNL